LKTIPSVVKKLPINRFTTEELLKM